MALRDKLRDRAQPFLEEGEQIQAVAMAQTGPSPWFAALTWLIVLFGGAKYYVVVFTDRSIVVLRASMLMASKPKEFVGRLPREVRVGDVSGLWAKTNMLGEKAYVHKRFHKDLKAADQALIDSGRVPHDGPVFNPPAQAQPAGWYPDPSGSGQRYWDGNDWTDQTDQSA